MVERKLAEMATTMLRLVTVVLVFLSNTSSALLTHALVSIWAVAPSHFAFFRISARYLPAAALTNHGVESRSSIDFPQRTQRRPGPRPATFLHH